MVAAEIELQRAHSICTNPLTGRKPVINYNLNFFGFFFVNTIAVEFTNELITYIALAE